MNVRQVVELGFRVSHTIEDNFLKNSQTIPQNHKKHERNLTTGVQIIFIDLIEKLNKLFIVFILIMCVPVLRLILFSQFRKLSRFIK